jgi:hypothetical protein
MKIRVVVIAACAATFALAQADRARAAYTGVVESNVPMSTAKIGVAPVIVLAAKINENDSPIPRDRSRVKRTDGQNNNDNSVGGPGLRARAGSTNGLTPTNIPVAEDAASRRGALWDAGTNGPPALPKNQKQKAGPGTAKSSTGMADYGTRLKARK